jgi:S1-C subfamily serine protease
VVGITTAIVPFAQGLGFAIPTSTTYDVIAQVTTQHRTSLAGGVLGISGLATPLDEAVVRENKLPQQHGVLLLEVAPDGAAGRASLRSGDIILALSDRAIETVDSLRKAIADLKHNSPWRVTFLREGRRRVVSLVPQR